MRPGFPEANELVAYIKSFEERLGKLERAARAPLTQVGSGGIKVTDDGNIQFLADDGTVILEIDKAAFTYDRADGTRQLEITPAGGLKIYDTNGTTEKVVLSALGLAVDGIIQPALAVLTESDASNPTVTNTITTVNEIEFTIPPWADEVTLVTFARLMNVNAPGADIFLVNRLTNDVGGLDASTSDQIKVQASGLTQNSSLVALTTTVSSPGATITCHHDARSITTSVACETRIEGIAIVRRTA